MDPELPRSSPEPARPAAGRPDEVGPRDERSKDAGGRRPEAYSDTSRVGGRRGRRYATSIGPTSGEAAHSYVRNEGDGAERRQEGGTAVADEGERDADDRQEARHHAQIDEGLAGQEHGAADGEEAAQGVPGARGDLEAAQRQEPV